MVKTNSQNNQTEVDKAWVDIISGINDEDLVTETQINKLIAEHDKVITSYKAEIKLSQQSIENLEYKKKNLKYGDNTILFEIADSMHSKQCKLPHEDMCGWFYSSWDKFLEGDGTRQSYYDKARHFADKARELDISIHKAVKFLNAI